MQILAHSKKIPLPQLSWISLVIYYSFQLVPKGTTHMTTKKDSFFFSFYIYYILYVYNIYIEISYNKYKEIKNLRFFVAWSTFIFCNIILNLLIWSDFFPAVKVKRSVKNIIHHYEIDIIYSFAANSQYVNKEVFCPLQNKVSKYILDKSIR